MHKAYNESNICALPYDIQEANHLVMVGAGLASLDGRPSDIGGAPAAVAYIMTELKLLASVLPAIVQKQAHASGPAEYIARAHCKLPWLIAMLISCKPNLSVMYIDAGIVSYAQQALRQFCLSFRHAECARTQRGARNDETRRWGEGQPVPDLSYHPCFGRQETTYDSLVLAGLPE